MEHEWEELFVVRHGENVYAGIDRCNNCKTIRRTTSEGFRYQPAVWYSLPPETEPPCGGI